MFVDLVRDAWRQYRSRPLAAVLVLLVTGLPLALGALPEPAGTIVSALLLPVGLVAGIVLTLFLVPYLGGVLNPAWPGPRASLPATWRSIGPGFRAYLLWLAYLAVAVMAGGVILAFMVDPASLAVGQGSPSRPATDDQIALAFKLVIGIIPLIAFTTAFLTTLYQRVLLDGERRVLMAATLSHRIARQNFPICLLIALLTVLELPAQSVQAALPLRLGLGAVATLLAPFAVGMANALYLRTRDAALASLEASRTRS